MPFNTPTAICNGQGIASGSSTTATATANIGDLVVIGTVESGTVTVAGTLADSAGNTWTKTSTVINANAQGWGAMFWTIVTSKITTGSSTFTYTGTATHNYTITGAVISGAQPSSTLDNNSTPTTGSSTSPSITNTPTVGGDLVIGMTGIASNASTVTQSSGFNTWGTINTPNASFTGLVMGYVVVAGTGTQTYNPSLGTARQWGCLASSFRVAPTTEQQFVNPAIPNPVGNPYWIYFQQPTIPPTPAIAVFTQNPVITVTANKDWQDYLNPPAFPIVQKTNVVVLPELRQQPFYLYVQPPSFPTVQTTNVVVRPELRQQPLYRYLQPPSFPSVSQRTEVPLGPPPNPYWIYFLNPPGFPNVSQRRELPNPLVYPQVICPPYVQPQVIVFFPAVSNRTENPTLGVQPNQFFVDFELPPNIVIGPTPKVVQVFNVPKGPDYPVVFTLPYIQPPFVPPPPPVQVSSGRYITEQEVIDSLKPWRYQEGLDGLRKLVITKAATELGRKGGYAKNKNNKFT